MEEIGNYKQVPEDCEYFQSSLNPCIESDLFFDGQIPYNDCRLMIQLYGSMPIKIKWFRIKNNRNYQIKGANRRFYAPTGDDVGYVIKAALSISNDSETGLTTYEIGPIQMNPIYRAKVENILLSREVFGVRITKFCSQDIVDRSAYATQLYFERDCMQFKMHTEIPLQSFSINLRHNKNIEMKCNLMNSKALSLSNCSAFDKDGKIISEDPISVQIVFEEVSDRDCIILATRLLDAVDYLALNEMIIYIKNCFFRNSSFLYSDADKHFPMLEQVQEETEKVKDAALRILRKDKTLEKWNQQMRFNLHKLEEELEISIAALRDLLTSKNDPRLREKLAGIQISLLDVSSIFTKIRKHTQLPLPLPTRKKPPALPADLSDIHMVNSFLEEHNESISGEGHYPSKKLSHVLSSFSELHSSLANPFCASFEYLKRSKKVTDVRIEQMMKIIKIKEIEALRNCASKLK